MAKYYSNNTNIKLVHLFAGCAIAVLSSLSSFTFASDMSVSKPDIEINYEVIESLKLTPVFVVEVPKIIEPTIAKKVEVKPLLSVEQPKNKVSEKVNDKAPSSILSDNYKKPEEKSKGLLIPWFHRDNDSASETKVEAKVKAEEKTVIAVKPSKLNEPAANNLTKNTNHKADLAQDKKPQVKSKGYLFPWFNQDNNLVSKTPEKAVEQTPKNITENTEHKTKITQDKKPNSHKVIKKELADKQNNNLEKVTKNARQFNDKDLKVVYNKDHDKNLGRRAPLEQPIEQHANANLTENIFIAPKKTIPSSPKIASGGIKNTKPLEQKVVSVPAIITPEIVKVPTIKTENKVPILSKIDNATSSSKSTESNKLEKDKVTSSMATWLKDVDNSKSSAVLPASSLPETPSANLAKDNTTPVSKIASISVPAVLPSEPSKTTAPVFRAAGAIFSAKFPDNVTSLNAEDVNRLTLAVRSYIITSKKISILSYAKGLADDPTSARRIALQRAVNTRAHIIRAGLSDSRINVQVMGDKDGGKDEVDILLSD